MQKRKKPANAGLFTLSIKRNVKVRLVLMAESERAGSNSDLSDLTALFDHMAECEAMLRSLDIDFEEPQP